MFTLTQGDGTRVQGFCRRFLPPPPRAGGRLRYPQVLCLVCEAPWAALFFKVGADGSHAMAQAIYLSMWAHSPPTARRRHPARGRARLARQDASGRAMGARRKHRRARRNGRS